MLTADELKRIKEYYDLNYPEYYTTAIMYFEQLFKHIEAMQKEIERKDRAIAEYSTELDNSCKCFPNSELCGACVLKENIKKILEGKE